MNYSLKKSNKLSHIINGSNFCLVPIRINLFYSCQNRICGIFYHNGEINLRIFEDCSHQKEQTIGLDFESEWQMKIFISK